MKPIAVKSSPSGGSSSLCSLPPPFTSAPSEGPSPSPSKTGRGRRKGSSYSDELATYQKVAFGDLLQKGIQRAFGPAVRTGDE